MATISRSDRLYSSFLLPHIHKKVFARQAISIQNKSEDDGPTEPFWQEVCPNTPHCWENQYLYFPMCLAPLKCGRKKKQIKTLMQTQLSCQNISGSQASRLSLCAPTHQSLGVLSFTRVSGGWKRKCPSCLLRQPTKQPVAQLFGTD